LKYVKYQNDNYQGGRPRSFKESRTKPPRKESSFIPSKSCTLSPSKNLVKILANYGKEQVEKSTQNTGKWMGLKY